MDLGIFLTSSTWITKIVIAMIFAWFQSIAFLSCLFGMIGCCFAYFVFLWRTFIFILSTILRKSYIDFLAWSTTKFSFRWALVWRLTWVSLIAITKCWLNTSIVDNGLLGNTLARVTSNMIFAMIGTRCFTVTFSFYMSGMIGFGIAFLVLGLFINAHCWTFWLAIDGAINTNDKTIFAWEKSILGTRALRMASMVIRILTRVCWVNIIIENSFLIIAHDQFGIFLMPWSVQKCPGAWLFPCWVPILTIFAHAFDISLLGSLFEQVTVHYQLITVIATEKLCYGKIFGKNGLGFGVDIRGMRSQTWTRDAWRELGGGPCVVSLAFDPPTALRSITLGTYCGTICTSTCNIPSIFRNWWFVSAIMPLFVWPFRGFSKTVLL